MDSSLINSQERLGLKFKPIFENARHALREYIKKKGKVDNSDEGCRSNETQARIDKLEDLMGQVDSYLHQIFEEFIKEVAMQHTHCSEK